jgi:hypothetical protein
LGEVYFSRNTFLARVILTAIIETIDFRIQIAGLDVRTQNRVVRNASGLDLKSIIILLALRIRFSRMNRVSFIESEYRNFNITITYCYYSNLR